MTTHAAISAAAPSGAPMWAWIFGLAFLAICFLIAWRLNGVSVTLDELVDFMRSRPPMSDREHVERAYAGVHFDTNEERERAIEYALRRIADEKSEAAR